MNFNAQVRSDIETLDVTINNYERMENAPEAWERIKDILAEVQKPSHNSDKTTCLCPHDENGKILERVRECPIHGE